jgi:transcriptional regulator with XRE-family HTH domain
MFEPTSWRDLLKDIISDPAVREQLAHATGVHPVTLTRWSSGEVKPRVRAINQLLHALPKEQSNRLAKLLEKEHIVFPEHMHPSRVDTSGEVDYLFLRQIYEIRAMTPEYLLFWTLCSKVLTHALRQLDPDRTGMAITLAQCMPPSRDGKIHSLRERMSFGNPPWSNDMEQHSIFLGAESLAGHVVRRGHPDTVQDLRSAPALLPAYQAEHEISATACPILYATRVAGCVLVSSTQPNYFLAPNRLSLIRDYTHLLALGFLPEYFYSSDLIDLRFMPPIDVQRRYLASFQQRVSAQMSASRMLSRTEAEQIGWQQIEEELIHHHLHES